MTLESVGIPTLLFAHLAVKLELLQPLGLDAIANVLGASAFGFGHGAKMGERGGGGRRQRKQDSNSNGDRGRMNACTVVKRRKEKRFGVWRLAFCLLGVDVLFPSSISLTVALHD